MINKKPSTIDEYIAGFPADVQMALNEVRAAIRKAAPAAAEAIKYNMPAFIFLGNLVYFAGYKHHIGFYPAPTGDPAFAKALSGYKQGKGSVQFPLEKAMPLSLISKMVKARIQRNIEKSKVNKKTK